MYIIHKLSLKSVCEFMLVGVMINIREHPLRTSPLKGVRGLPQWGHGGGVKVNKDGPFKY